jgi:hypothetical protein
MGTPQIPMRIGVKEVVPMKKKISYRAVSIEGLTSAVLAALLSARRSW